ncbi:hypothetical protein [Thiomicrorhabdus sp.]|uniref:hypothetical protein n=1 Tax=Thiomicrorhabdus sp. TaxID=2039724 RepID=UPI0029C98AF7|nr:hypothetical protein [Thiomicrorhabdus sp.]
MRIQSKIALGLLTAFASVGISSQAFAAEKKAEDSYVAGVEAYAKTNPTLAPSMQAYVQDLKKAMKANPKLNDTLPGNQNETSS